MSCGDVGVYEDEIEDLGAGVVRGGGYTVQTAQLPKQFVSLSWEFWRFQTFIIPARNIVDNGQSSFNVRWPE